MNNHQTLSARRVAIILLALVAMNGVPNYVLGQGADLIWSPRHEAGEIPIGDCFFRKQFTLVNPEKAQIYIAADDAFELYVNGQRVHQGSDVNTVFEIDVTSFLQKGPNLISFKVENFHGDFAGIAARLRVKEKGETRWRSLKTDETWKTRTQEISRWYSNRYDDLGWLSAGVIQRNYLDKDHTIQAVKQTEPPRQSIAEHAPDAATPLTQASTPAATNVPPIRQASQVTSLAAAADKPAANLQSSDRQPQNLTQQDSAPNTGNTPPANPQPRQEGQYQLEPEFKLQKILSGDQTGSIIAIAFNEFGNLVFSKEGGPLMVANLTLAPEHPERVTVLCDQVTSCQGILPLNGDVYVTGDGPSGLALYRLGDKNSNGQLTVKSTLLNFKGDLGEHGPHGVRLGPDGMIYCIIGNGSGLKSKADPSSPYRHHYEGDLVPRYEDPSGHASGTRGPGGTLVRVSVDGSRKEVVAGGIRNAYDFTFDQWGELFIHDSDMESDIGMSWYRPTAITHVVPGAELGWRSGWAKFPEYYADTIPPAAKTGRGSPTGAVCYQHLQFPARYHNSLFFADWSEGRILVASPSRQGASTQLDTKVFLSGKPLNVTDLAVGEDGGLYFSTGGRGTEGGLYRILWNGNVPASMLKFDSELSKVIRHPQPNSAWARQNIAILQNKMASHWKTDIRGIATESRNKPEYRIRALDILVVYGPFPDPEFLKHLSQDKTPEVRAKVASICGLRTGNTETLRQLIGDSDAIVRRNACESFLRLDETPEIDRILNLLKSEDRFETVAARRLLERIPAEKWFATVLSTDNKRQFINGSLAAMAAHPTQERATQILNRSNEFLNDFVSDSDFIDMLRVMQVCLVQGKVDATKVPGFVDTIEREFPSKSGVLNRELARILAFFKAGELDGRIVNYFETSQDTREDKVHVAMFLQTIGSSLSDSARLAIINQLEEARTYNRGGSYRLYLARAIGDVSKSLSDAQVNTVLENGHRWPIALIPAFYRLPHQLTDQHIETLIQLDKKLQNQTTDTSIEQARLGVIAVLAQDGSAPCMDYLRQLWQTEKDRRSDVAIGLAQQPDGENWPYLVSSLPVLDDTTSVEVLTKLTEVDLRPKNARFYQQVLELGYRLENEGAIRSAKLIEHWSGESDVTTPSGWKATLNHWKQWYETKFPEGPSVSVPKAQKVGRYSVSQVSGFLDQSPNLGDAEKGHILFTKAQCASCHRYGSSGDSTGPDLTSIASRFSRREIVEAIVDPSKVISDQYKSKTILTESGMQFSGMMIKDADGYTLLQSNGEKVQIAESEVDQIKDDIHSSMPQGLLDSLSQEDIRDLFAYIYSSNPDRFAQESSPKRQ